MILATGNEVQYHRIEDTFTQLWRKIKEYGAEVTSTKQLPDDNELLTKTILEAIENGGRNGIVCRRSVDQTRHLAIQEYREPISYLMNFHFAKEQCFYFCIL